MNKRDAILILLFLLVGPAYYFTSPKAVDPGLRDALKDAPIVAVSRDEAMPDMSGDDYRDAVRNSPVPSAPGIIEEGRPEKMPPLERLPDIGERFTREHPETPEVSPSSPQ